MLDDSPKKVEMLRKGRSIIPGFLFQLFQPLYHWTLAWVAAINYGFPSKSMKIIGVTGTKGKSTTALMVTKIFEQQGKAVAMIGSLGFKIRDKEWPNTLKMTMPGRFKLQKFLYEAKHAGCEYVVIEVTSEGIAQKRLSGVYVDCAVFTNLHKEHIENHGSFEAYKKAKLYLFRKVKNIHVINKENIYSDEFLAPSSKKLITYGLERGDVTQKILGINLQLMGVFNVYNALAAISVAHIYGLDFLKAKATVEAIKFVPGRMEYVEVGQPFDVIVDYAHTPESLEYVYQTLKPASGRLICVLGAAGGGRDKWKRPVFGEIAANYCDDIILTNEDPYDEKPEKILDDISVGILQSKDGSSNGSDIKKILDRTEAINFAIHGAKSGDVVIITGKGSEISMALANGKKMDWSDREVVIKALHR